MFTRHSSFLCSILFIEVDVSLGVLPLTVNISAAVGLMVYILPLNLYFKDSKKRLLLNAYIS